MNMEMKLRTAAENMPEPKKKFREIVAARNKTVPGKGKIVFRVAIAVVIVLSLAMTGLAYGAGTFGLWSGMHSKSYGDVVLQNWKYGYEFPENLGGSPFLNISTYYGAPNGATHLEALLKPTYRICFIEYGVEKWEDSGNSRHYWTEKQINVSFGTTENDNWKYHFSAAEDGSCVHDEVLPGTQKTLEYEGYILNMYEIGNRACVRWVDEKLKLVIDITTQKGEIDVLDIAKELIDLNR